MELTDAPTRAGWPTADQSGLAARSSEHTFWRRSQNSRACEIGQLRVLSHTWGVVRLYSVMDEESFARMFEMVEPRLRRALVA